jgi:hypothetical protein
MSQPTNPPRPKIVQFDFSGRDAAPIGEVPDEILTGYRKMSPEDFEELQKEIFVIKAKIEKREDLTLEEEKKINIWYRERRGIAISLVVEKAEKTAKAKPVRKTASASTAVKKKSVASVKAQAENDIFAELFG